MCKILAISRSGYYKHKKRVIPAKEKVDQLLGNLIVEYDQTFDGILGYRRMAMFINRLNHKSYSEAYIYRLMQEVEVSARIRRKKLRRKSNRPIQIKENLLARDFSAKAPNEKWLTDVTEFAIPGENRKLFLSSIMDLYDNSIIEYQISYRNNNKIVFKMFDKAIAKYPDARPIFHSDRGFQYTGKYFQEKLKDSKMTQSMSRAGKCLDNAPKESFFGSLKTEMFYGKKFASLEELKTKIESYIKFYNEGRYQKRLDCMTPLEYRYHATKSA